MSRRHAAEKREVLPDAKFGDRVLTKFMNNLMIDGKKSVAERIVYNALDRVEGKLKRSPVECFHEALDNVKPSLEVRSRRVGGATYQVPVEVRPERREALAIRWSRCCCYRSWRRRICYRSVFPFCSRSVPSVPPPYCCSSTRRSTPLRLGT